MLLQIQTFDFKFTNFAQAARPLSFGHRSGALHKGKTMAKGKNSKKETKKPKQEKAKVSATSTPAGGRAPIAIGGKKVS